MHALDYKNSPKSSEYTEVFSAMKKYIHIFIFRDVSFSLPDNVLWREYRGKRA